MHGCNMIAAILNQTLMCCSHKFGSRLLELSKQEINRCGDVQKILASIDV